MRLTSVLALLLIFASCKKEEPTPCEAPTSLSSGMLVFCEGLFQQNNSSVSFVDFANGVTDNTFFINRVGRQLGDTGNDMQRYGGKIYIAVNISSTVEVLDAGTFESIAQIPMVDGGTAKQPRSIAFYGSNAYVTCFDGYVDVIDTASLNVTTRIAVGTNPEGLSISNGKLYVANSGGLNAPVMDSTVSVIDLATHQELSKITVGLNPGGVVTDASGDVYVITRGNYGAIPSRMVRIDTQNDVLAEQFTFDAASITHFNDKFLIGYYDYGSGQSSVGIFNPSTEQIENSNFLDVSGVTTLYGVHYDDYTHRIYVSDAMNFTNSGYVRAFDVAGSHLTDYHVGLNPSKLLFYD